MTFPDSNNFAISSLASSSEKALDDSVGVLGGIAGESPPEDGGFAGVTLVENEAAAAAELVPDVLRSDDELGCDSEADGTEKNSLVSSDAMM